MLMSQSCETPKQRTAGKRAGGNETRSPPRQTAVATRRPFSRASQVRACDASERRLGSVCDVCVVCAWVAQMRCSLRVLQKSQKNHCDCCPRYRRIPAASTDGSSSASSTLRTPITNSLCSLETISIVFIFGLMCLRHRGSWPCQVLFLSDCGVRVQGPQCTSDVSVLQTWRLFDYL